VLNTDSSFNISTSRFLELLSKESVTSGLVPATRDASSTAESQSTPIKNFTPTAKPTSTLNVLKKVNFRAVTLNAFNSRNFNLSLPSNMISASANIAKVLFTSSGISKGIGEYRLARKFPASISNSNSGTRIFSLKMRITSPITRTKVNDVRIPIGSISSF